MRVRPSRGFYGGVSIFIFEGSEKLFYSCKSLASLVWLSHAKKFQGPLCRPQEAQGGPGGGDNPLEVPSKAGEANTTVHAT